jgi:hypothetical protein
MISTLLYVALLGTHLMNTSALVTVTAARTQQRTVKTVDISTVPFNDSIHTRVSLLPFQIQIEFTTISSPDSVQYAIANYLLYNTQAKIIGLSVIDKEVSAAVATDQYSDAGITNLMYNGSALVAKTDSDDSIVQNGFQHEQRMALMDPSLDVMLQQYFETAIQPYVGQINVRGVELMGTPDADTPANLSNENLNDFTGIAWYTIAIASAGGAAGCVIVLVLLVICIVSYRKYWNDQLQVWKYSVDRERDFIVEGSGDARVTTQGDDEYFDE